MDNSLQRANERYRQQQEADQQRRRDMEAFQERMERERALSAARSDGMRESLVYAALIAAACQGRAPDDIDYERVHREATEIVERLSKVTR